MYSVTQRISKIKQPYGGYVPTGIFFKYNLDSAIAKSDPDYVMSELYPKENLHGSVVGLVVDYLVRLENDRLTKGKVNALEAFNVSFYGGRLLDDVNGTDIHEKLVLDILSAITGLDDLSIVRACQVIEYDTVMRQGPQAFDIDRVKHNIPDEHTIKNIRELVTRTVKFFTVNPITVDGFTFEGGYTDIVNTGDGDFLTEETLWDLKVLRSEITNNYTLQVYMYYLMGMASGKEEYKNIKNIGFVNPRLNLYYILDVRHIPEGVVQSVKTDVLGLNLVENIYEIRHTLKDRFAFDSETGTITGYDATSTSKTGNGMNVRIPDEIDGVVVKHIGKNAFHVSTLAQPIELLLIPATVESIGERAFYGNDIFHVAFDGSVDGISELMHIGEEAFTANRLRELRLPNALWYVDKRAFFGNPIRVLDLGNGITRIDERAFAISKLSDLYLPSSLKQLDKNGFTNIRLLKSVSIGKGTNIDGVEFDSTTDIIMRD